MILSKEALLKVHTGEDLVDVPELGGQVRVRGLSRAEVLMLGKMEVDDARDALTISLGMVDPPMSPDDVMGWNGAALTDEIDDVRTKILVLSKLMKDAAKELYRAMEDDPSLEFPVLPGEGTEDDGGSAGADG